MALTQHRRHRARAEEVGAVEAEAELVVEAAQGLVATDRIQSPH